MATDPRRPWLDHYPKEVPPSLDYPDIPVPRFLEDAARDYPERAATIFFGARRTYAQIRDEARRFAVALGRLGVHPGDRVALILPNCPQAVAAHYGALYSGAVVVWVNPLYTVREMAHQLQDSGARAAVALDLVHPRLEEARRQAGLETVMYTSIRDRLPFPLRQIYPLKQKLPRIRYDAPRVLDGAPAAGGVPGPAGGAPGRAGRSAPGAPLTLRYDDVWRAVPPEDARAPLPGESLGRDDLALLQYTGGTTGVAKGVMLTHGNLVANTLQAEAWLYRFKRGEGVTLGVLPFFHVYGLTTVLHYAVRNATTMILIPRFDVRMMVDAIERYRVQIFPGAPTMYVAVNRFPGIEKRDLSSIDACISGSAPLPLEVQAEFERLTGGRLVEGYGLSEASPVTHCNPVWGERRPGSIGLPWPDTDARIVHPETGEELGPGEVGELCVRGPQVMKGYWNRPDETALVLKDGWLYTGDLATMDADGYFRIVDRKKDVIIAGGFNVYPREVEEVLYQLPAVEEAVVFGVPDPYRGETVKAVIKLKPGQALTAEEVERHCRSQLTGYKVPRIIEFRDELPKSAVGKILRRVLVEEARRAAAGEESRSS
ncbi:MAG: long-chain fatty acid--CoA ligase [Firmicutes bacterium]|nr:long-chain fatty acid--CoA ligase [Bacillota bacterium]